MKRFTIIVLAAALLVGAAFAESQLFAKPVAEMSLEELKEANLIINNEITARAGNIEGVMIEPGMYIVGEDIPEGSYYFEGVEGRYTTSVNVYPSIEKTRVLDALQDIHGIGYGDLASTPKTGRVILKNGNAVKIVQGPAVIHIYKGLMN